MWTCGMHGRKSEEHRSLGINVHELQETKNEWSYASAPPIYRRAVDRDDSALLYMTRNSQENNFCFPNNTRKSKLHLVTSHAGPERE
jgi:hypothetical protein